MSNVTYVLRLIVFAVVGSSFAFAQGGTSAIRGTVTDPQHKVIQNASVTITSLANNSVRNQKTGPNGNFSFDLLPPGDYRLEVEAATFKKGIVDSIHALIERPTDLTVQLSIGANNETVTVSAESGSVQVNTQDSSLGNNFISKQITELPMEARDVLTLLTLQPGVTKDGYVAGARSDQSNITLDGIDINDAQSNDVKGPVLRLNSEAIEEFRVSTISASAGSGRSSGAQISLVTKGGTNHFHGSLFEYHRNTIFTANDWFNNHNGVKRPTLLRNTFGGAVGGPIVKDKFFFFYSLENRRDASSKPVGAQIVPLPSLGQGLVKFPNTAGGITTLTPADLATIFPDLGGVNPAAVAALNGGTKYQANSTSVGDGLNTSGFSFNAPAPVKLNSHVAKFDYIINNSQSLSMRTNVIWDHDSSNALQYLPDTKSPALWSHPWGLALAHTWTVHNNLINSFHYGMTREGFSQTGDLEGNNIYFRLVYLPVLGTRTNSRVTPVHNFVDDLSWTKGNHTFQFGGNVTLVSNRRISYSGAWDSATTNPSGYKTNTIINSVNQYLTENFGYKVSNAYKTPVENAITALLGRFTQYTANFTFDHAGKPLASGVPSTREFATQGYEGYFQDVWKLKQNLTVSAGIRYSLWRPVYERQGFEVQPQIPLGDYYDKRVQGMNSGTPYLQDIILNLSGPANGGPPMYNWDKTNFLPHVAAAWSPKSNNNFLTKALFGNDDKSVIRGGFAMLNDYFGQQIATFFDQRNTLGFSSATVIPVNTYNVGCGHYVVVGNGLASCTAKPGPLFTAFGQNVRSLPGIVVPGTLTFPQQKPEQAYPTRIESSLDSALVTPKNYAWSVTFERELPKSTVLQISYIGRLGRHLLAQRDVATPLNLKDPKSGMDWYTAATMLEKARQAGTPVASIAKIPYFENLFPLANLNGAFCPGSNPNCYTSSTQAVYDDAYSFNANDWTTTQLDIDSLSSVGAHAFYQPQYGALTSWTTIGNSIYNALAVSVRQRMKSLTFDFNYTYSHSLDDASGLQTDSQFASAALILNPFRQQDSRASSDFDMRHVINVNAVWQLPFGKGKLLAGNAGGPLDAIIGGWQLSNIFRWNSGIPFTTPYDANTWSTNWENQSATTLVTALSPDGCPTRNVATPQFFGGCLNQAFSSFRSSYPGETGQRNYFRFPSYVDLDFGLGKSWNMPYKEGHVLQFRWEVFNATNTQHFGENLDWSRSGWGIAPGSTTPAPNFSNFKQIQGTPRVMQFGLVYRF